MAFGILAADISSWAAEAKEDAMLPRQIPASAITLLLLLLILTPVLAASREDPGPLKPYVSQQPAFMLVKPENWKVQSQPAPDSLRISVGKPDASSFVEAFFADNSKSRLDALKLLARQTRELRARYPDLSVSDTLVCKDGSCATATMSCTRGKVAMKGRFYVQTDQKQVAIRSYWAPVSRWASERNLLLNILANVRLGTPQSAQNRPGARSAVAPIQVQLIPRRAPDGSLSLSLPADWNFQAARGRALALAPDGRAGFIFTSFDVMPSNYGVAVPGNVIVSPYRPPSSFISTIFAKFGNRDIRVLGSTVDRQTAGECPRMLRRACDVEDMTLRWISPKSVSCAGAFKVINARPSPIGHWFSIVAGIWGPAENLAPYLPMLERISASFSINDQYAKRYIQQGLANLRVLQQKTQQAMQSLNDARAQNQKDWEARQAIKDNVDSKWDDYRRGNSYWISELEGGKVYKTDPWGTQDSRTGDRFEGPPYSYLHFEGENPRHPSENMREVSSYELEHLRQ